MLSIREIEQAYPARFRGFRRNMLREYLQYKILALVFDSSLAHKLSFLGGTALRIVYNNNRFSEDIDFDHFDLSESEFQTVCSEVQAGLELEGYTVELRHVSKGAYRCYVRFPGVLFDNQLSTITEEKILIQLDTAAHGFAYQPEIKTINKFDVFTEVFVTPLDILLAQKLYAAVNRPRAKGRDFFDIVFLTNHIKPNYNYLQLKLGIRTPAELKALLTKHCQQLDFSALARDVQPFLFTPRDAKRVKLFPTYIKDATW